MTRLAFVRLHPDTGATARIRDPRVQLLCELTFVDNPLDHCMESCSETSVTRHLASEAHTLALGEALGRNLVPGLLIFVSGPLGAGKTTLARGVLRGLGYRGKVKSPTFTLVELYELSRLYLYHFDFYRLDDPHGWLDAGLRDYFGTDALCLVEWPEKAAGTLPAPDIEIQLAHAGDARDVRLVARSTAGRRCLSALDP